MSELELFLGPFCNQVVPVLELNALGVYHLLGPQVQVPVPIVLEHSNNELLSL